MEEKIDRFYPLAFITESQKVGFGADCIAADIWASTSPLFLILLRLGLLRYPSHLYQPLFTLKTKFTWWISFKCKGFLWKGNKYISNMWGAPERGLGDLLVPLFTSAPTFCLTRKLSPHVTTLEIGTCFIMIDQFQSNLFHAHIVFIERERCDNNELFKEKYHCNLGENIKVNICVYHTVGKWRVSDSYVQSNHAIQSKLIPEHLASLSNSPSQDLKISKHHFADLEK